MCKKTNVLITQSNALSVCCKAKIKMNPVEWATPHHVKTWEFWCLKCEKKCEAERIEKKEEKSHLEDQQYVDDVQRRRW